MRQLWGCLDFLDKSKGPDGPASHERRTIQAALRHWFLAGTAPLDEHGTEKRVDQILKTLASGRTPMTPEEAEREWLSKRSNTYSSEGKYWVSQQGEAFESGNQLPVRLEKQAIANRVKDGN